MISKFCPVEHLILIFKRRILPPPRTIWAVQVVSHFSNKCSFTVYTKSALDLVGQFFSKNDVGDMSKWGDKNISGEIYHGWCHVYKFPNLHKSNVLTPHSASVYIQYHCISFAPNTCNLIKVLSSTISSKFEGPPVQHNCTCPLPPPLDSQNTKLPHQVTQP